MSAVWCRPTLNASPERIRTGWPIGAGRLAALVALMALALLAGCGGIDAATPSPSGSVGTASGIGSTEATTPRPADPGTPPTEQTVAPTGDLAYDPIPRTVTGVVERPAGCTVLVVGQNRFVLSGDMAATLTVGSRMTVTGNLTFRPSTCAGETGQELQVTRAIPA